MASIELLQEEIDKIINNQESEPFSSPVNRGVLYDNLKIVKVDLNSITKIVNWEAEFDLNYKKSKVKVIGSTNNSDGLRSFAIQILKKVDDAIEKNK